MQSNKVVSLAEYKAKLLFARQSVQKVSEPEFPEGKQLWELLDRNISLSAWEKL